MVRSLTFGVLLLTAACYHGPDLAHFAPAQGPRGIDTEIRLKHTRVLGELLEVQDSSLVILTDSERVALVPIAQIQSASFEQLGTLLEEGIDPSGSLPRLRSLSRFPAGLTPALLAGEGIGDLPPIVQPELVRDGRLVEVMPKWHFPTFDLSLVYLSNRLVPRPVRVFKEFAVQMAPTLFPTLPS